MPKTWILALALVLAGPALAGEPDRSALSFEDNVTVNTACFAARKHGQADFDRCVQAQVAALKAHPAPDRTALTEAQTRQIERDCAWARRIGVADYNDCLAKAVTASMNPEAPADKATFAASAGLAKALVEGDAPPVATPVATMPPPRKILPHRPDHLARQTIAPAELYKKLERSVFVVGAARSAGDARARDIMQGSAVAISEHLLLTNCHVVRDRPVIVILQQEVSHRAKLVAADNASDRCVIESDGPALVPVAGVRPFADLAVGERVFAIGAPRALERTLTEGLVSGLRPGEGRNLIQTSAPLSPGSSGGGLFDERGNLLGITTLASLPGSQNLNFAIAASDFWE
jgi:S1-C subfamily serine protease